MAEPLPDTWNPLDLPILQRVVATLDARPGQGVTLEDIALGTTTHQGRTFDNRDVLPAVRALEDDGLIEVVWIDPRRSAGETSYVARCTGEARRKAGSWPTADSAADRLIAALESLAERGTEDERSRAKRALEAMTGAGRQIAIGVATAVITGQVT